MVCISAATNLYHSQCSRHVACDVVSFVGVLKIVCTLRCWLRQIFTCIRQVPEMRLYVQHAVTWRSLHHRVQLSCV